MKQKSHSDSKKQSGFNADQFRRHYVSAVDTDQSAAWSEAESTGYLGRVFMVLLLMHVFLIGAVVLYNVVADKPKTEMVESSTNANKKADAARKDAVAVTKPRPKDSIIPGASPKPGEMGEYQVRSGDSLKSITEATGVKAEDIIRINQLDTNGELYVGRKLLLPAKKVEDAAPKAVPVNAQQITSVTPPAKAAPLNTAGVTKTTVAGTPQEVAPKLVAKPKTVEMAKLQLEQGSPKPVAVKVDGVIKEMLPEEKAKTTVVENAPPVAKPVASAAPASTPEVSNVASVKTVPQKTEKALPAKSSGVKSTGSTHGVKSGETFYSIARKYGVSINDLMKLNGYTKAGSLRDGVKLKIPAKN